MKPVMIVTLAALLAAAPLAAEQTRRVDCVAAIATVAFEQARGSQAAAAFPPLAKDGARFAQVVGAGLVAGGRSKEQARDALLAAAAARQQRSAGGGFDQTEITACIALMQAVAPAPPPRGLPQCAGLIALAVAETRKTGVDKDLETIAAVLDSRARDALRAEGKSASEADAAMASARVAIEAEARLVARDPLAGDLDPEPCLELARP